MFWWIAEEKVSATNCGQSGWCDRSPGMEGGSTTYFLHGQVYKNLKKREQDYESFRKGRKDLGFFGVLNDEKARESQ